MRALHPLIEDKPLWFVGLFVNRQDVEMSRYRWNGGCPAAMVNAATTRWKYSGDGFRGVFVADALRVPAASTQIWCSSLSASRQCLLLPLSGDVSDGG